jgi:spore germination cell wall hydrolase CwlJ-like protein
MITTLTCMAIAVYYEARGEPTDGQLTVAEVIMNRATDPRWPDTPCEVVRQTDQFSFYREGARYRPEDAEAFVAAVLVAQAAWEGKHLGTGALWFHAEGARPAWRHRLERVGRIGDHVFYADRQLAPTESPRPERRTEK